MTLKFTLDTLEGVDEALHGLYSEADGGGFVLSVDGAVSKAKFDEVNQRAVTATDEAQRRRKTVERVTSKLGLETADGLDAALEDLLSKKGGKSNAEQEEIIRQIKTAAAAEAAELRGKLQRVQLGGAQSQFKAALMGAGFGDKVSDMLAVAHMNRLKLDDDGNLRIMQKDGATPLAGGGAGGFAEFSDLAKELAKDLPELITDTGKGGGGKPPASGGSTTAKTATRSQYDAMSSSERVDFFKQGGKVLD